MKGYFCFETSVARQFYFYLSGQILLFGIIEITVHIQTDGTDYIAEKPIVTLQKHGKIAEGHTSV